MSGWRVAMIAAFAGAAVLAGCHAAPDTSATSPDDEAQLNTAAAQLDNATNATETP